MLTLHTSKHTNRLWWGIVIVALVAAVLYYSWPLGYWLNPVVGRHGLASDLEATGQPYRLFFITLDVISGALIVLIAAWLALAWRQFMNLSMKFILIGYGLFGALTALDALLPMNCLVDEQRCGSIIHNPTVLLHGIASIGSIGGLTLSIVGIWQLVVITNKSSLHIRWLLHAIMIGWFGFGLLTLWLILTSRSSSTAQHVFITICSLWTVLMPFLLARMHSQELEFARIVKSDL